MVDFIPSMINQNQSAFVTTNSVSRGDGGHGRGHRGGARGSGGRSWGGPPGVDRDKLQCTHCGRTRHTRDTWALVGRPPSISTTFTTEASGENV